MTLEEKIIRYRAKHRLSQKQMADLCGITLQTLCNVENGIQTPGKITVTKIQLVLEEDEKNEIVD